MENDSVQSRLMELQSFSYGMIDVDPLNCVLMSVPRFLYVLCMTLFIQVDRIRIFVTLVSGTHREEAHCLSVVQILTSKYQSRLDDGMLIYCTSDMINVLEKVALNNHIVLY